MILRAKSSEICESNNENSLAGLTKVILSSGSMVILALSLLVSGQAFAGDSENQDERLGAYALSDEGMLGRYGDVNDEWVQSASSEVSSQPMTVSKKAKSPKKDNRLGAFSMEDSAMLGHYGDHNDE